MYKNKAIKKKTKKFKDCRDLVFPFIGRHLISRLIFTSVVWPERCTYLKSIRSGKLLRHNGLWHDSQRRTDCWVRSDDGGHHRTRREERVESVADLWHTCQVRIRRLGREKTPTIERGFPGRASAI